MSYKLIKIAYFFRLHLNSKTFQQWKWWNYTGILKCSPFSVCLACRNINFSSKHLLWKCMCNFESEFLKNSIFYNFFLVRPNNGINFCVRERSHPCAKQAYQTKTWMEAPFYHRCKKCVAVPNAQLEIHEIVNKLPVLFPDLLQFVQGVLYVILPFQIFSDMVRKSILISSCLFFFVQ